MALDAETVRQVKQLVEAYKQYVDDRIEDLVGQRIRRLEAERDAMSKPSVKALVKTMLGPIEDRLRAVEGKTMRFDSPEDAAEWRNAYERQKSALVERALSTRPMEVGVDPYGPHIAHVPKLELERLRRIEEEVLGVLSYLDLEHRPKLDRDSSVLIGIRQLVKP